MRVNSMNASILTLNYDDAFGRGARREQVFLYSISAPHCEVTNLQPEWVTNCTLSHGSASQCHQHILNNFDELLQDRLVQVSIDEDFGIPGQSFLKCIGWRKSPSSSSRTSWCTSRTGRTAVTMSKCRQSMQCAAMVRNKDWKWGLFAVA